MEDKIFDIVTDLLKDDISKNEAIDKLLLLCVSNQRELLIDCVKTCLKDNDSVTVEQQVDTYLLNKVN
jgi:hypothetical protein